MWLMTWEKQTAKSTKRYNNGKQKWCYLTDQKWPQLGKPSDSPLEHFYASSKISNPNSQAHSKTKNLKKLQKLVKTRQNNVFGKLHLSNCSLISLSSKRYKQRKIQWNEKCCRKMYKTVTSLKTRGYFEFAKSKRSQ